MGQRGRLMTVKIKDDFYLSLHEKFEKYVFIPYVLGALLCFPLLYYVWIHQYDPIFTRLNLIIGYAYFSLCLCMIYYGFYFMGKCSKYAKMKSKAYNLGMSAYPNTCLLQEVHFQNKYFKDAFCDGYFDMVLKNGFNSEEGRFGIL